MTTRRINYDKAEETDFAQYPGKKQISASSGKVFSPLHEKFCNKNTLAGWNNILKNVTVRK